MTDGNAPVARGYPEAEAMRRHHADEWQRQIINAGGDENVALQAVTLAALNGLFDHLGVAQGAVSCGALTHELCGDELNGGLIRDLAFTVWTICHEPKHQDGNSDWGSDTLPTVQKVVEIIRKKLMIADDRMGTAQKIIAEYQASTIAGAKADVAAHGMPGARGRGEPDLAGQVVRLRYAIIGYLEVFDRCGGSESVSPETFSAARQDLRDAVAFSSTEGK